MTWHVYIFFSGDSREGSISLLLEYSTEKAMTPHSSVLAWKIPGTGEPGGLCLWGRTELDTTEVTWQQQSTAAPIIVS